MILQNGRMRAARIIFVAGCLFWTGSSLGEDAPLSPLLLAGSGSRSTPSQSSTAVIHTTVDRRPGVMPPISRAFLQASDDATTPVSKASRTETQASENDQSHDTELSATSSEPTASAPSLQPKLSNLDEQRLGQEEPVLGPLIAPSETMVAPETPDAEERILRMPDLRTDIREFPSQIWSDTRSLFTLSNGISIGLGAGLTAIAANNWDQPIRDNTAAHPRRWGGFNNVFDVAGHPATAGGVAAALYATSLIIDDPELHDFSGALASSLILTNVSAVSLKYAFDTTRPNGESHGFPSGHTASAFAVAAVVQEYQGGLAGTAAYVFAGLVAWQRIDDRKHDLSDVLFGMVLGEVIGRSVAKNHRLEPGGFQFGSYFEGETGTTGISLYRSY